MWDFASPYEAASNQKDHEASCHIYFDKFISFARRLFEKWKKLEVCIGWCFCHLFMSWMLVLITCGLWSIHSWHTIWLSFSSVERILECPELRRKIYLIQIRHFAQLRLRSVRTMTVECLRWNIFCHLILFELSLCYLMVNLLLLTIRTITKLSSKMKRGQTGFHWFIAWRKNLLNIQWKFHGTWRLETREYRPQRRKGTFWKQSISPSTFYTCTTLTGTYIERAIVSW